MFFVISKILGVLIDPLFVVVMLLLAGWLLKRLRKTLLLIAVFMLLFFSNPFIVNQILKKWEPRVNSCVLTKKYEFGIVLTGMMNYEASTGKINFLRSSDRIWQTVKLYKQGIIKKIFISGGAVGLIYKDTVESAYLKKYLVMVGLPENDIITEEVSRNTYENALFTSAYMHSNNITSSQCVLITSASHMRRAAGCFAKQGFIPDQFPVDHYSGQGQNFFTSVILPGVNALWQWNSLLHEWLGYASYKISGYI